VKLALVVPGGVDRSGRERVIPVLLALIRRLAREHEVHVFALAQEPEPGHWMLAGASIHNVGARRPRSRAFFAIRREHRRGAFALVHAVWSGAPGLVAVAAARSLGVPSIVHVAGGELAALADIGYGGRLTWRGRLRERLVLRAASAVSAASAPMVAALADLGVRAERIVLGVDLDEWPAAERPSARPGTAARLVQVASLNRVKDQTTLLEAVARLVSDGRDVQLDHVGEDTLGGAMHALAGRLGLAGRVRFHGFVEHRELRRLMATAALAIVSSRHEAGPLVVLEAALAGVPTVGTAVGHVAEFAPDAAVAVPVADPAALAAAIAALLDDEPRRLALAAAALARARRENADETARRFLALYARVQEPPRLPPR